MKIIYVSRHNKQFEKLKKTERDFIALYFDRWDDFHYKTQFPANIICDGEKIDFDLQIKILIYGTDFSGELLEQKIEQGWDGVFPIPNEQYVSVPSDIDFYGILIAKFGIERARGAILKLRDAGYLLNIANESEIDAITKSAPFQTSLLREPGAVKSFKDGWLAFKTKSKSTISDFELSLTSENETTWEIPFRFNSTLLPYDINVIIGSNGVGKSYCLKSLVEYWLKIGKGSPDAISQTNHTPFDRHPNLERLILVSYSPFEEFVLDLTDTKLINQDVYKYFGFRRRGKRANGENKIGISRNLPATDSVNSIIECIQEDAKFNFLPDRVKKIKSARQVLREAIEFDEIALPLIEGASIKSIYPSIFFTKAELEKYTVTIDKVSYLIISDKLNQAVSIEHVKEIVDVRKGVTFLKDSQLVELSSGQRMFSYIVINILGAIRNNSLVVIDEPELFLHPNLEITLISLLKDVLRRFASKAIIATHSLVTVREIPANCVHVIRKSKDGRDVIRPPFETFGGDVQRISSYVFGDRSVSKPFESWLAAKLKEYGNASDFIAALGQELNEEMLLQINYLEGRD